MRPIALLIATLLLPQPASAATIYTCTDDKGRKTFSQMPCAPDAQVTTVQGPDLMGSVATDSEATDKIRNSNRLRSVGVEISRKESEIDNLNDQMSRELAQLKAASVHANNNLAGAAWQQSLATEMQATAEKYKVQIGIAHAELSRLHDEQKRLQGTLNQ